MPAKRNSRYKGPEAGSCLMCSASSKKTHVAKRVRKGWPGLFGTGNLDKVFAGGQW